MKIIDLLNKIANGETDRNNKYQFSKDDYCTINDFFARYIVDEENLNLEIIEEKKIPEKLSYYSMEKIQKAKNKDEWREERISLLEKRIDDYHIKINEIIDFLKSKGDE